LIERIALRKALLAYSLSWLWTFAKRLKKPQRLGKSKSLILG